MSTPKRKTKDDDDGLSDLNKSYSVRASAKNNRYDQKVKDESYR